MSHDDQNIQKQKKQLKQSIIGQTALDVVYKYKSWKTGQNGPQQFGGHPPWLIVHINYKEVLKEHLVVDQFEYTTSVDLSGFLRQGSNRLGVSLAYLQKSSTSSPEGRIIYGYGRFNVSGKGGIYFQDQFTPWRTEFPFVPSTVLPDDSRATFWQFQGFSFGFSWQPEPEPGGPQELLFVP